MHQLQPNTILMSRYKIVNVLSGSEISRVYQAHDLHYLDVKRMVIFKAVEIPPPFRNEQMRNTILVRANQLMRLEHPAFPKILDSFSQNECIYLVTELMGGSTLMDQIHQVHMAQEFLPVPKVIGLAIAICEALVYLHQQSEPLVYADLQPAHVIINLQSRVRLTLPITLALPPPAYHDMEGQGYAAPDRYKGQITPSIDIYGLGATLHHTLTGNNPCFEPPFSFSERPIRALNPNVPDWLAEIIDKALQFDPKDRWQSAAEMKAALESL